MADNVVNVVFVNIAVVVHVAEDIVADDEDGACILVAVSVFQHTLIGVVIEAVGEVAVPQRDRIEAIHITSDTAFAKVYR